MLATLPEAALAQHVCGCLAARDLEALASTSQGFRRLVIDWAVPLAIHQRIGLPVEAGKVEDSGFLDLLRFHDVFEASEPLRAQHDVGLEEQHGRSFGVKEAHLIASGALQTIRHLRRDRLSAHDVALAHFQIPRHLGGDLVAVRSLSFGRCHCCIVTKNGALFVQGDNSEGQLGLGAGTPAFVPAPTRVRSLAHEIVRSASAGLYHTCVLLKHGVICSAGSNLYGQLGLGADVKSACKFTRSEQTCLRQVLHVTCGRLCTFAITTTGRVFAWGQNRFNQLGLNEDQDLEVAFTPRPSLAPECRIIAVFPDPDNGETSFLSSSGRIYHVGLATQGIARVLNSTTTARLTST